MSKNTSLKVKPLTSIIILTKNNLRFTRNCIFSIFQYTRENFELILIDNGSTDGTLRFLRSLPKARVIANRENKGFPEGCNQGLSIADGEYIVILNNDTVVTDGWLTRLLWWLNHDDSIGIVGPRSNFVIPEQIVSPIPYITMEQMHVFAKQRAANYEKEGYEAQYLSGLCMAFKKDLIDNIGGFDERFSPGYYEDTDFSVRARIYGKKLWVANDAYIHHYGSISFKKNKKHHMNTIINESRKKFNEKWNIDNIEQIKDLIQREKPFNKDYHFIPITKDLNH